MLAPAKKMQENAQAAPFKAMIKNPTIFSARVMLPGPQPINGMSPVQPHTCAKLYIPHEKSVVVNMPSDEIMAKQANVICELKLRFERREKFAANLATVYRLY